MIQVAKGGKSRIKFLLLSAHGRYLSLSLSLSLCRCSNLACPLIKSIVFELLVVSDSDQEEESGQFPFHRTEGTVCKVEVGQAVD